MNWGELLTRLTVWIALGGYALGVAANLTSRTSRKWQSLARGAWTIGCLGLLAHVTCAFHFYYGWSQASAYRETARQTAAVVGFNWGGGLWINYGFITAWIIDVLWWWQGLETYSRRPRLLVATWHGLFMFMVFNATVVFKTGIVRWLGLALCVGLGIWWWLSARRTVSAPVKSSS